MKKITFVCIAAIMLTTAVFAQEGDGDEKTIEDLYLQTSIQTQIIKAEAYSQSRDMKQVALTDIARMIEDGSVDEDSEEIISILYDLGQEGITRQVREQGAIMNNYPMIRREACELLGEIGGDSARRYLTNILLNDLEPTVLAEAVMAIGKIGLDEDGRIQTAMASVMYKQTALSKDNNFAVAYLNAIEMIIKNGGEITDPFVWEEVAKIVEPSNGYATLVRTRALTVLKNAQEN